MLADVLGGVGMSGSCKRHPLGWLDLELMVIDVRIEEKVC